MRLSPIIGLCLFTLMICVPSRATTSDWPQFRGPTGQGVSDHANPPLHWNSTKNIRWKTTLPGEGWSSPIVYSDSLYVSAAMTDDQGDPNSLRLLCIDKGTGQIIWNKELLPWQGPSKRQKKNSYASPTPLADNDRLYVHFGHMGTACVTTAGEILWQQQTVPYEPEHGNGGSPILIGDKLVFSCDGKRDPFVVALHKDTGQVIWRTPRQTKARPISFSTPLLVHDQGQPLAVCPGSGVVGAYSPPDGTLVWQVRYGKGFSVVPRPVYGHGMIYVCTGFGKANLYAIRLGGKGDITDTHIAWQTKSFAPNTPSPLLLGNELYFIADNGTASCVDAQTGSLQWQKKLGGKFSASPVAAAGRIYWLDEAGKTTVLQAGPVFKQLAENDLGERTLASPALSERALFIRTQKHLYRLEEDLH